MTVPVRTYGLMSASAETKDPSGGTTGRVKLYGRLGWMGARAEYSLDGEGLPLPPVLCRGRVVARSKDQAIFLALSVFWAELLRRGRVGSAMADLSDAIAAAGWFKALLAGISAGPTQRAASSSANSHDH